MAEDLGVDVSGAIEVVSVHAEGEVGDVIVGGVAPPPGSSIWEQARWIERDGQLRDLMLNEPRGGVFRHVNLLVPAVDPAAAAGFIIMEPCHTPPMSGSNSICVATVLLETGHVPITEPITRFTLEAPGGLVDVEADCRAGKAERVRITNVASFVHQRDAMLDVPGKGRIRVDIAYGGDSFVLVDASDLGLEVTPDRAHELASVGRQITAAANEQLGFVHPTNPGWSHISFCQIAEPLQETSAGLTMTSTSVIDPGKLDRSPTGTGVSARLALLHAQGRAAIGDSLLMRSVIGSEFVGRVLAETEVGPTPAIVPQIEGRAWITGTHRHLVDRDDPFPRGYRVSDTWPGG